MFRAKLLFMPAVLVLCSAAYAQQFVNESSSRFPLQTDYSSQLAIADVDGDGDLDIAFANGSGFNSAQSQEPVRLYINDGDGFFAEEGDTRLGGLVGYGRDVEFGDVDNDGDLDLVVANDFNTAQKLLINDGNGNFSDESDTRLPALILSSSHASFGDVDNDGDLDIWFTNGGTQSRFGLGLSVLCINNGMGFFTNESMAMLPQVPVQSPMDSIFGDIDGDFDLDMVVGGRSASSRIYTNDGSGIFTDTTAGNLPAENNTYSYDFGDLDNDGDLDLVGANSLTGSSREAIFVNDGNGSFEDQTATWLPGTNNPNIDDNDSKFIDYDNDGDLDLLVASLSGSSGERLYRNEGSTFTLLSGVVWNSPDSSLDLEVGDMNGDGTLDFVTCQGESGNFRNKIYMNEGVADSIAPVFPHVEQLQDTMDESNPYVVRAVIRDSMTSDHNFFADRLALLYSVNGAMELEVELRWSGGDVYRAEIPAQAAGSIIQYRFEAVDHAGNLGQSQTLSFEVFLNFKRGDVNTDGDMNMADTMALLGYLFPSQAFSPLLCADAADLDDNGHINLSDVVNLVSAMFPMGSTPAVAEPFTACGHDPTTDSISCSSSSCP